MWHKFSGLKIRGSGCKTDLGGMVLVLGHWSVVDGKEKMSAVSWCAASTDNHEFGMRFSCDSHALRVKFFMWQFCDFLVTFLWLSCSFFVAFLWLPLKCHTEIFHMLFSAEVQNLWLPCYFLATFLWLSCDSHATFLRLFCDSYGCGMWLFCDSQSIGMRSTLTRLAWHMFFQFYW
jgi:hypothetical protein